MRRWFTPLDDKIIQSVFQPLTDMMADRFGLDRPRLACFCLDLSILGWLLARLPAMSDAVTAWNPMSAVPKLVMLVLGVVALLALRTVFRRFGGKPGANPLRLSMRPHRAIILLLLVSRPLQFGLADMGDVADLGMLLFAALGLYLGACSQPPANRHVARQAHSAAA